MVAKSTHPSGLQAPYRPLPPSPYGPPKPPPKPGPAKGFRLGAARPAPAPAKTPAVKATRPTGKPQAARPAARKAPPTTAEAPTPAQPHGKREGRMRSRPPVLTARDEAVALAGLARDYPADVVRRDLGVRGIDPDRLPLLYQSVLARLVEESTTSPQAKMILGKLITPEASAPDPVPYRRPQPDPYGWLKTREAR